MQKLYCPKCNKLIIKNFDEVPIVKEEGEEQ